MQYVSMADKRIIIVDDEPDIVELVSYNLRKEGFTVSAAADGNEALRKIRHEELDLIILDLMLPGIPGMELCRMLRSDPKTAGIPIIMLTAKGEEVDRVLGLEIGADDYMTKPFSPRELVARVKAVMRRTSERSAPLQKTMRIRDLEIDAETFTVRKRGERVHLSSTEFKLLQYLAERKGRIFSRDQLLDAVWSGESYVEPRTVDVHIRRIRTQIEDDSSHPVYLKTRRGIGYYVDPEA